MDRRQQLFIADDEHSADVDSGLERLAGDQHRYIDVPYMGGGTPESSRANSVCEVVAANEMASNNTHSDHFALEVVPHSHYDCTLW